MNAFGNEGEAANAPPSSPAEPSASSYTWWDVVVAGAFTAVPAAMWVMALGYNAEARRIPLLIATPLTLLAVVEFISRVRGVLRDRQDASVTSSDVVDSDEDSDIDVPPGTAYLQPLAFLASFVLSFLVFGQLAGTAIFAFLFLWRFRALRLVGAAVFAATVTGVLWATAHLLEVEVYQGMLYDLVS